MRGKTHAIRLSRLLLFSWPKSLIVGVVASYSLGTPKVGLAADGQDSVDGKRPVVLIAMDGAGTCFKNHAGQIAPADISLADTMHKAVAEIQSKGLSGDVSIIHSCLLLDGKSGAYSTTLGEPTVVEDVQLDDLLPQIAARVNALHDPQVVIMGFSYGGWLALKLLPLIADQANILGVLTIDPISIDECKVIDLLNGAINGESIKGCTSSPTDLSSDALSTAAKNPGSWLNVYQDRGFYLHSGSLMGAKNILNNHDNGNPRSIWTHLVLVWDETYTTWMSQELVNKAAW